MFKSDTIPTLVTHLLDRRVHLYHACQFQDFCSYLKLGGIPSRKALEDHQRPMTPFTTDGNDQENGVWDKVFLNLEDFGKAFARGHVWVPNVYGPILFRFRPKALLAALDVAICLRSPGFEGFNREQESLKQISEVDRLFYYLPQQPDVPYGIKSKKNLKAEFGDDAESVEVSCTFPDGLLKFVELIDIVVDPYSIDGTDLAYNVLAQIKKAGCDFKVYKRRVKKERDIYQIFLMEDDNFLSPVALIREKQVSALTQWAHGIQSGSLLLYNYYRFLQYLRVGTYLPIMHQNVETDIMGSVHILDAEDLDPYESLVDGVVYLDDDRDESEIISEEMRGLGRIGRRVDDESWFYPDYE